MYHLLQGSLIFQLILIRNSQTRNIVTEFITMVVLLYWVGGCDDLHEE